jgi:hypothetical protein
MRRNIYPGGACFVRMLKTICHANDASGLCPPSYYNGNLMDPQSLVQAYFGLDADPTTFSRYDRRVYVFENMVVSQSELKTATERFIWIGNIQCYFFKKMLQNSLKRTKQSTS